ncbi:MAG: sugar phosphate nucleotidyltransferase, partial [bacterium]
GPLLEELYELLKRVRIVESLQNEPKGLGHAVMCTRDAVGKEPFVVILPDVLIVSKAPCCRQLMDAYAKCRCSLSATEHTPRSKIQLYGIYDIARSEGKLHWARGVVEKPAPEKAPSDLSVVGRYLFTPEIFDALAETKPGRGGEIQLADAMNALAKQGRMAALEYEGRQFDTGDPIGFLKANIYFSWQSYPNELADFVREMVG